MKSELFETIVELNSSHDLRLITVKGIVKELSVEFRDDIYGIIQFVVIQTINRNDQQLSVQRDINIIFLEDHIGMANLGDRIEIIGVKDVYNARDRKKRDYVIVTKEFEIINDEDCLNLTSREINTIQNLAEQPFVHQNLANYIFANLPVGKNLKLIGTLILFCTDSPILVKHDIHSYISLLIVGTSGTCKTTYLQTVKKLLPNTVYEYSQKSDVRFVSYNSRYKKGGEYCKKAGLSDLAKNGIIIIDNLEELKQSKLSDLDKNFFNISKKCSLIAAAHTKNREYNYNLPVHENLQFPRKNNLLGKFDLVLVVANDTMNLFEYYDGNKKENIRNTSLPVELLKKYMSYVKREHNPILTKEGIKLINRFKEKVIKLNKEKNYFKTTNITNLVRVIDALSKAGARITLRNEVEVHDVQKIIDFYEKSLINLDLI